MISIALFYFLTTLMILSALMVVFSRNPMYVGISLILFGEAFAFGSGNQLVYAVVVLLGFHSWVLVYEEPKLGRTFGESYKAYCARVPRWIGIPKM